MRNDFLYKILIISSIIGYWIRVPKFNQIYLFHIVFTMFLITGIIKQLKPGNKVIVNSISLKYVLFLLTWYLYIVMSYFWSESTRHYFQYLIIYTIMLAFTITIIFYNYKLKNIDTTFRILESMFIIVIIIGLMESFEIYRLPFSPYSDGNIGIFNENIIMYLKTVPTVFFHNTNNLATYLIISISFLISYIIYEKRKHVKYRLIILFFISIIVLLFTNSRANFIGLAISILTAVFVDNKKRFKKIIIIISIVCIIGLGLSIYNEHLPLQIQQMTSIFTDLLLGKTKEDGSIGIRVIYIKAIIEMSKIKIFGLGAGNVQNFLEKLNLSRTINPHNWWLEILADFGLVFFMLYILFYINLILKLYIKIRSKYTDTHTKKYATGCFIALTSFIVSSTSPSTVVYFIPHWLLIGISISIISLPRENEKVINLETVNIK